MQRGVFIPPLCELRLSVCHETKINRNMFQSITIHVCLLGAARCSTRGRLIWNYRSVSDLLVTRQHPWFFSAPTNKSILKVQTSSEVTQGASSWRHAK